MVVAAVRMTMMQALVLVVLVVAITLAASTIFRQCLLFPAACKPAARPWCRRRLTGAT